MSANQIDPALQIPYRVHDHTINDALVIYTSDITWTRAMKFILTDLKWVIAWVVKHGVASET